MEDSPIEMRVHRGEKSGLWQFSIRLDCPLEGGLPNAGVISLSGIDLQSQDGATLALGRIFSVIQNLLETRQVYPEVVSHPGRKGALGIMHPKDKTCQECLGYAATA